MVTLALHDNLWAAVDAENCGLYKVWRGGVKFDGSVYTAAHGPQPTSEGAQLARGQLDQQVWSLHDGTKSLPGKPVFRGYTLDQGRIFFTYELSHSRGKAVIQEAIEFQPSGTTGEGIFRGYRVSGVPNGWSAIRREELKMLNHTWTSSASEPGPAPAAGGASSIVSRRFSNGTHWERITFREDQTELTHELRASTDPEPQVQSLAENRERGLSMRLYYFQKEVSRIPTLVEGQTANVNKVIPKIDLSTDADFGGFTSNFMVHITGYLNVARAGAYKFRLTSDDGSRFTLRDEKIIDHDGLHSAAPAEGQFTLSPGEHPIFIEYFEGAAENVLRLEWQVPGSTAWEVIPAEAFSTFKGEVRVVAPGVKQILEVGEERRPGDRRPLDSVHPAFTRNTVRPDNFQPRVGGIDFLPDGRAVICNWEPDGGVYVVNEIQDPTKKPTVQRIAFGLAEPLGIRVVDGKIYVLQKQELTRLDDLNGDGVIDRYYALANGWGVTSNFHEFAFGLVYDKGYFYANLAIAIDPGGKSTQPQNKDRGRVLKIGRDGRYSFVAHGLRTPNGIGFGPDRQIFITDNQGDWLPSSKVLHLREGAFYGSRAVDPVGDKDRQEMPPVLWLPQNEIGNSPSETEVLNKGPYKNQLLHGDVTHGGVKRSFLEKVKGQYQGAVFRFTQGLEGGVNRIRWSPSGELYVGGIGSSGNWGQEGKKLFGLEKLTWNGKVPFEMLSISSRANGFEVSFTYPIGDVLDLTRAFSVQDWKYVPTVEYGGPKVDTRTLSIKSVTLSPDRRRVFLELPNLQKGRVVYVHVDPLLASKDGKLIWQTEAWYTLNEISDQAGMVRPLSPRLPNTLTEKERKDGWTLAFNGTDTKGWTSYWDKGPVGSAWRAGSGELTLEPGTGNGGDIVLPGVYADFDLVLEWKASPGGNSGIFYRVDDSKGAPYDSGPEYQILDNARHGDGRSPLTSAGSVYALYGADQKLARPAGEWNLSRIRVQGSTVQHWLNGFLIKEYELGSADWKAEVAKSKFRGNPRFGASPRGKIVLQDHGQRISFRSIKIKSLDQ
jgi:cytochrome c